MEIQQHDGVVVDVAGSRQGFAKLLREGEVLQGRRDSSLGRRPPRRLHLLGPAPLPRLPIYSGGRRASQSTPLVPPSPSPTHPPPP